MPRTRPQPLVQSLTTVLPPVRGLNTTGNIAGMRPDDALEMDNFISGDLGVTVREGWRDYAVNIDSAHPDNNEIRTVFSYSASSDLSTASPLINSELFATTDQGIWFIEGGGDMTGVAPEIALSGSVYAGRMNCVQFVTVAGVYLIACSETDGAFIYNGISWMKCTSVGGPGPGYITGANPAEFAHVVAFKKRLMFTERGSGVVWILPVGQVGGAVVAFDFGPLLRHGGMVLGCANWTQDAGEGTDDRLVILGSAGDLLIYSGNDPTSADDWANNGTWYIGQPPVGRRCFTSSGGNVFVLTQFGVIPVNQIVQGGLDNILTSDTDYLIQIRKLQDALNRDFANLLNTVGWELLSIPSKALLFLGRPVQISGEFFQYAYQQHNLAWSRLVGIPAVTFGLRLNEMYGGCDNGRVIRVLDGNTDGMDIDGDNAEEVRARITPAFSYFGSPTVLKQALMCRVNFLSNQSPGYALQMNTDFAANLIGTTPVPGSTAGSLWDQSFWDQAYWAGGRSAFGEWRSVEALGYSLTASVYVSANQPTTICNIEYMMKAGGPL